MLAKVEKLSCPNDIVETVEIMHSVGKPGIAAVRKQPVIIDLQMA